MLNGSRILKVSFVNLIRNLSPEFWQLVKWDFPYKLETNGDYKTTSRLVSTSCSPSPKNSWFLKITLVAVLGSRVASLSCVSRPDFAHLGKSFFFSFAEFDSTLLDNFLLDGDGKCNLPFLFVCLFM